MSALFRRGECWCEAPFCYQVHQERMVPLDEIGGKRHGPVNGAYSRPEVLPRHLAGEVVPADATRCPSPTIVSRLR